MNRRGDQQSTAHGNGVQPDVVHLSDSSRHEPLHPLVRHADCQAGARREYDAGHIGTVAPRPVEQEGQEPVLDKMERLDERRRPDPSGIVPRHTPR